MFDVNAWHKDIPTNVIDYLLRYLARSTSRLLEGICTVPHTMKAYHEVTEHNHQ